MGMLTEQWARLKEAGTGGGGGYRLQLIQTGPDLRVYAAVSEDGLMPGIFVEVPKRVRPRDLSRITTRTFEAVTADFSGLPQDRCAISIQLKDLAFEDLFSVMGEEIIQVLRRETTPESACRGLVRCIDRWRRFVEKGRRRLSDEAIRGLIGELVLLMRCVGSFGALSAIQSWSGPTGALRDFELPNYSVEVKTFQSDTGASVRINDPEQLDISNARPVYLAAVKLSQVQSSGMTLPEYVQRVEVLLEIDSEAKELLQDRLADYGYLSSQANLYTERYLAGPVWLYQVEESFPRIRSTDVPSGVENVQFSIALRALDYFRVDPASVLGPAVDDIEIQE
jgi:putative PD-(D/E)XK family protein DUF4420